MKNAHKCHQSLNKLLQFIFILHEAYVTDIFTVVKRVYLLLEFAL